MVHQWSIVGGTWSFHEGRSGDEDSGENSRQHRPEAERAELANAVGVLHTSHKAGDSPASSVTGENPSLADVDDASSKASGSAKGSSGKKLASAGRMLSFGRAPKSKK